MLEHTLLRHIKEAIEGAEKMGSMKIGCFQILLCDKAALTDSANE